MSIYKIRTKTVEHELHESSGVCINASAALDWAVSLPWDYVRNYCESHGWLLIPQNEQPCNVFTFHGSTYEVHWNGNRIMHLTKDGEPITWQELPEQLKGLI